MKSNNADEQHNVTLRRWNHEEKKLYQCEKYLFRLKHKELDEEGW